MQQPHLEDSALARLMQAAQRGDARAYEQLLTALVPHLRSIVRHHRRFFKPEDIEDLVQDVLLSVHAVRATYDPRRPFIPWLMAITRNRLADSGRRFMRQGAHEVQVEKLPVTFHDENANRDTGEYRDPEALRQAIMQLPRGQREAIEMLKLRQMSLKEASTASGASIGALKVSVHRAIASLRKALGKVR